MPKKEVKKQVDTAKNKEEKPQAEFVETEKLAKVSTGVIVRFAPNEKVLPIDIEEEVKQSYLSFAMSLSLIHISEPTRLRRISYAVFCLKKIPKTRVKPVGKHEKTAVATVIFSAAVY